MAVAIKAEAVPLKADQDGVLRVGGTRVTLDTVICAFEQGVSPEKIVDSYDVLRLEDVYSVIGYYLRHRPELDAYLAERKREGEANIAKIEAGLPWSEVKAR